MLNQDDRIFTVTLCNCAAKYNATLTFSVYSYALLHDASDYTAAMMQAVRQRLNRFMHEETVL